MIGDECAIHFLKQHVGKVQNVAFSAECNFLSSLGGQDDNSLVVWNVNTGIPICGAPAGADTTLCVKWLHGRNDRLVTCGFYQVRVWQVDFNMPKLHPIGMYM